MILYTPLTITVTGIVYILLFVAMLDFTIIAASRKIYRFLVVLIPLSLVEFVALQCLLEICDPRRAIMTARLVEILSDKIIIYLMILGTTLVIVLVFITIWFRHWNKTHITRRSIAEALNGLTEGICCYYLDGQILLLNKFMRNAMGQCCATRDLRNGCWLERRIFEGNLSENSSRFTIKGETAIMTPEKRVFLIRKNELTINEEKLKLLTASDITEEYRKTEELYKEQTKLRETAKKLLDYRREIVDVVASKEILNAKVKIHDSLGEELLAMRHYIEGGGSDDEKNAIKTELRKSMVFLLDDSSSGNMDEYELMVSTAKDLGVDIIVDGELPEEKDIKHVLASGMHICFTNTIRHAKGDKLFVKIRETNGKILAEFRNNGIVPTEPIEEKSGLTSLRELVEKAGGDMEIEHNPEFVLEIALPKEVTT